MIEELLLWLWLFLRVSGFVQQSRQLGPCKIARFVALATLEFCHKPPYFTGPVTAGVSLFGDFFWL